MKRLLCLTVAGLAFAGAAIAQPVATDGAPAAAPLTTESPGAQVAPPMPASPPVATEAPLVDPNVYQVLRPGDRAMSCAQLGAEANTLNAQIMAEQQEQARQAQRAKQGRGIAGGLAGGVLGGAARYGLARGMVGGAFSPIAAHALAAAADSGSAAVGQAIANGSDVAAPTVSPQQQRMNHLLGLYREKGC